MKTIAIDQSPILISSFAYFANSDKIKSKEAPLSNPEDVEMFGNILISRVSNILCDVAEPGDLVVACFDEKDANSMYWRHSLPNRVAGIYKLNRDSSVFENVDFEGLLKAKAKYEEWCTDNGISMMKIQGFEADDIIAELVGQADQAIIISPDGDFNQLITTPKIIRIDPIRWRAYRCEEGSDWFGDQALEGMWADAIFKTLEITDVTLVNANLALLTKILTGDSSDCIPSVHTTTAKSGRQMGVGPATAAKMIKNLFSDNADVLHYNDLSDTEKTIMCGALKNPDVKDVIRRMDENAEMIILRNKNLSTILKPVSTAVTMLRESVSTFNGVDGVTVAGAGEAVIKTVDTPNEFADYEFR